MIGEHYITSMTATNYFTFVACRCGWFLLTTSNPEAKWIVHRDGVIAD